MPDDLLTAPTPAMAARPAHVPAKFWDEAAGALRVDALLKSYIELERRFAQRLARPAPDADPEEIARWREMLGVPATADAYEIAAPDPRLAPDAEVNRRLHAAGFTPAQVQLVYDLAGERLLPLIAEAASEAAAERERDRLRAHFGGEERFRRIAGQLAAWGRANLPEQVFETLATSAEGVIAMARMMEAQEPPLPRAAEAETGPDEAELRRMMRDPRYWRAREPDFVRRVTEGFRRLVGE
jgi:hypothetical protein